MARKLVVTILGDSKSLERAYDRSTKAGRKFEHQVRNNAKAEEDLLRVRSKRASSVGLFRLGAVGLGGGAALVAATQGVRALGASLETTGAAAFTAEGRLKNMVAALTGGDFVGAI